MSMKGESMDKIVDEFINSVLREYYEESNFLAYSNQFKKVVKEIYDMIDDIQKVAIQNKLVNIMGETKKRKIYAYFSFVTEMVLAVYLLKTFPQKCKLEVKIGSSKKDVDFQIKYNDYFYNIEAKTVDLYEKDHFENQKDSLKVAFVNRMESKNEFDTTINQMKRDFLDTAVTKGGYDKMVIKKVSADKIKDYLISCQEKLEFAEINKYFNILFIALDSAGDIIEYYNYLTSYYYGFLNEKSYVPSIEYNKIDLIVISNIVHGHRDKIDYSQFQAFDLKNYFAYFLVNPFSERQVNSKKYMFCNFLNYEINEMKIHNSYVLGGLSKCIIQFIQDKMNGTIDYEELKGICNDSIERLIINAPSIYYRLCGELIYVGELPKQEDIDIMENVNNILPNHTINVDNYIENKLNQFTDGEFKEALRILFLEEYIRDNFEKHC